MYILSIFSIIIVKELREVYPHGYSRESVHNSAKERVFGVSAKAI